MVSRTLRMNAESSTTRTRNFLVAGGGMIYLRYRYERSRDLRSHELFYGGDELIFLHGLGQESRGAFFHRSIAMFFAGARSDHQHRDAPCGGPLAELGHQFIAGHARHFEVGDDQVAAVLRNEFGGFETVGGEFDAIAVLLEHASDEFAHADGVVGDDDQTFLLDAVDGFARDSSTCYRRRTRSEDAGGASVGLQGATFGGLGGDHAVQIDEQNQAAIGCNGGAGKDFYATEIFAEALDNDFVFADDFFDDETDFAVADIGYDHVEVTVDGLERRQSQVVVQTYDLGDNVADFGE